MPKSRFEDAVQYLNTSPAPNPMALGGNLQLFADAFSDLGDRLANLEFLALENKFRIDRLETEKADLANRFQTVETEHTQYRKRVEAIEKQPAADAERIDAIEKRVGTVEGAVGSKNYRAGGDKAGKEPAPAAQAGGKPTSGFDSPGTRASPAGVPFTPAPPPVPTPGNSPADSRG